MADFGTLPHVLLAMLLLLQNHLVMSDADKASERPAVMTAERYKELSSQIDVLSKSNGMNDYEAFEDLGKEFQRLTIAKKAADANQFKKDRAMKSRLLLRTFVAINQRIDPNFNFKDAPSRNISPPAATKLPAGIAAREIKDPELRQQYEEAIFKNAEKAKVHQLQNRLRRLRERWPDQQIYNFARDSFDQKSKQDRDEWQKLIDEEIKDKALQKQIHETFAKLDMDYVVVPGGFRIGKPTGPTKPKQP